MAEICLHSDLCQVLRLEEASNKFEQENKFMAEALEDLQDSTSRLEAENRSLKMSASLVGRPNAHAGTSGKVRQQSDMRGLRYCSVAAPEYQLVRVSG